MSTPAEFRTKQLAQIHLGKKQLGLDEDTYRDLLQAAGGKRSAAEMDSAQRAAVIAHMVSRGAKLGFRGKAGRNLTPQEKMVRALWWQAHKVGAIDDAREHALRRWVARQCGGVEDVSWLTAPQVSSLIEALKAMIVRAKARSGAAA